ncbi:EAL domain-containing protein [Sphingomonas sp. 2R-10]|uniref:EAL domain-containing protein n=1 Tax=Sphingomonas sp. 2R-10 TaxID=3045148 RepID=UPI0013DDBF7B|nr:EAL domain-containing protein [Sphingomonas sp. 2R-10]MDJ0277237.1 EAL domain-containing protein [Sphingomonas sp. 2R-10]
MANGGLKAALRSWVQRPDDAERLPADRAARLLHEAENHGPNWFWQTDRHGRLTYLSDKIAAVFAAAGIDPIGAPLTDMLRIAGGESIGDDAERTIAFHLSARTAFTDYAVAPAAPGESERSWTVSGSPFADPYGRFEGFVGTGTDMAAVRRSDAAITRLALFDSLTGLANRQRMRISLEQTLAQPAYDGTALFLLDLDRFKAVNDTMGHPVGDALLSQVAQRLLRVVADAGLVGRLGGDEFEVILPRIGSRTDMATLAQAIIASLSQPYFINGSAVSIGCSIGIAVSPDHGTTPDVLVANADLALYAAKDAGRGVARFFNDAMLDGARIRRQMEDDLRLALSLDQLRIVYQPVVSLDGGRITGFEALLRWEHPTRGLLIPADFLCVAEESKLIEPIGEWVLRTACHDAAAWPGETRLSVNLSAAQFANPALPAIIANALARAGLAPGRLEVDIEEASLLRDMRAAITVFAALRGIGVRLALNDFGAGQASMSCLRRLAFDRIKIDSSFVRGVSDPEGRNAAVIRAIATLADMLGIDTTAKGIEYHDELAALRELGCNDVQGFVYGAPVDTAEAAARLMAEGGALTPNGPKAERAPRTRMLRSTTIEVNGERRSARIRDLSTTGALIDLVDFDDGAIGSTVRIDTGGGNWTAATLRWAEDGRAGLHFEYPITVERRMTIRRR